MKQLALTIAATALGWFGTTTEGSARPFCGSSCSVYLSTYTRCGCPIYVQRYVAYFDHCGRPVWQTRVLPVIHHCRDNYRPSRCRDDDDRGPGGGTYSRWTPSPVPYWPSTRANVVIRASW